jgi:hypothetical protein
MSNDFDKTKPVYRVQNKRLMRLRANPTFIRKLIKAHSGQSLAAIAGRIGLPVEKFRELLQPILAGGAIFIDQYGQVYDKNAKKGSLKQQSHKQKVTKVRGRKSKSAPPTTEEHRSEDRSDLVARIRKNRRVWVQHVDAAWVALNGSPAKWRENRQFHLEHVRQKIIPSAPHYLSSSQVDGRARSRAAKVLAVYRAIQSAETSRCDVDPRAFAPFNWPSTEIKLLTISAAVDDMPLTGTILATIGYRVGRQGLSEAERRDRLEWLFLEANIPDLRGLPCGHCGRLARIARLIAFHVKNAKGQDKIDKRKAISDWESDLAWMKVKFYNGTNCEKHSFSWPST